MLIVGLGNPDKKYQGTYHNVGFAVVDALAELLGVTFKEDGCHANYANFYVKGERVVIAKPYTYMNLSGEAVQALSGRFNVPVQDILVVYDDIDLPLGEIRIRKNGSAGTHNGMRNIVAKLSSTDFPRMRLGIGRPEPPMQLVDYVLSHAKGERKETLEKAERKAAKLLAEFVEHRDIEKMMRESK